MVAEPQAVKKRQAAINAPGQHTAVAEDVVVLQ